MNNGQKVTDGSGEMFAYVGPHPDYSDRSVIVDDDGDALVCFTADLVAVSESQGGTNE